MTCNVLVRTLCACSRTSVGLIGAGIDASLSPALHEAEAAALGLDYSYRLLDIDRLDAGVGELLERARDEGYSGLNVTHPCKQDVVEHLDELSPEAAALDAVNTVVFRDGRAIGHNTDASGFAESFRRGLAGAPLGKVVVLGAGGAGAAVAHAALRLGAQELVIVDVDDDARGGARGAARRRDRRRSTRSPTPTG